MANSIAKILDRFFDNKMEDFETAFPAVIDVVNDDGTVNVRPSVRNCLRNMQMEPLKDGKLMAIRNVQSYGSAQRQFMWNMSWMQAIPFFA